MTWYHLLCSWACAWHSLTVEKWIYAQPVVFLLGGYHNISFLNIKKEGSRILSCALIDVPKHHRRIKWTHGACITSSLAKILILVLMTLAQIHNVSIIYSLCKWSLIACFKYLLTWHTEMAEISRLWVTQSHKIKTDPQPQQTQE